MSLLERFGGVVREARIQQGWSQERLAEKARLDRSYLGEVERGRAAASLIIAQRLATALNIKLSALISRSEVKPAAPEHSARSSHEGDSL